MSLPDFPETLKKGCFFQGKEVDSSMLFKIVMMFSAIACFFVEGQRKEFNMKPVENSKHGCNTI